MFTKKEFIIPVILLLLAAALLAACGANPVAQGAAPAAQAPAAVTGGITVVGHGEAFGQPDLAEIQAGVETFAESVSEATSQNEATIEAVMAALEAEGIAARDVQTSNYSVWAEQVYGDRGPEGIAGYRVSNMVSVTIRDISQVGQIIGALTGAGANSVHGIHFRVADPAALEADARAEAIADARQRAQSLAELSGVELGSVISVSEVIGQQPIPFMRGAGGMDMAAEEAAPSISPGELSYSVQVQVTFGIE